MADSKITALSDGGAVAATDEFVVARSGANNKISGSRVASSGILAVTQYAPGSIADKSVTGTTLTALDTTNLTVSFTVPDSGIVLVMFHAAMVAPSTGTLSLGLKNHSGGAQLGNTWDNVESIDTNARAASIFWYLTGLSAGTLGIDIAAGVTTGTGHIYAQGRTGASSSGGVGPALIVVHSA